MLSLDLQTLSIVVALVAAVMASALTVLWHSNRGEPGTGHWALGAGAIALGLLLLTLNGLLPGFLTAVAANTLLVAGSALLLAGTGLFTGRPVPDWIAPAATLCAALAFAHFLYGRPDLDARLVVLSAMTGGFSLWTAVLLLVRPNDPLSLSRNLTGLAFAGHGAFLLLRGAATLLNGAVFDLMQTQYILTLSFLEAILALFCIAIGFLSLTNRRLQLELEHQARHDALTGVANRRALEMIAGQTIALRDRHRFPLSVLLMDLDRFKAINDRHGHAAGDVALRAFVATALESLRCGDVLGRFGGEEFCAILPYADEPAAHQVAERLRQAVRDMSVAFDGTEIAFTVSIGVASNADGTPRSWEALIRDADAALYRAKQNGRDRVAA